MGEINFVNPKIEENVFEEYEAKREKIENMMHEYRSSLLALGHDPEGKDLIEVITFLANTLNKVMCTLQYHKKQIESNYMESLAGRIND